jgi:hypothetical protein
MRIVDVCAFYTPHGGGVKTYVEQKLKIGPTLGHEIIILAPGDRYEVIEKGRMRASSPCRPRVSRWTANTGISGMRLRFTPNSTGCSPISSRHRPHGAVRRWWAAGRATRPGHW